MGVRGRAAYALLAALLVALFPGHAWAQVADDGVDTETADARAVLLSRGQMVKMTDIDFGQIAMPEVAGTVTLIPTPTPTCVTSAGIVRQGPCVAAEFAVMERRHSRIRIRNQSGNTIVLTGPGGATMTMTNITHSVTGMSVDPGNGGPPDTIGRYRIETDSGIAYFRIGGRLNVGANQMPGHYVGQIIVMTQLQ